MRETVRDRQTDKAVGADCKRGGEEGRKGVVRRAAKGATVGVPEREEK